MRRKKAFNRRLLEVKRLQEEAAELTDSARHWAARHMAVETRRRGGPKVSFRRHDEMREARRHFGYFTLVMNQAIGTFKALRDYRMREWIEEFFGMDKRHFDGRLPPPVARRHSPRTAVRAVRGARLRVPVPPDGG